MDLLLQSSVASNFSSRNETGIGVGKVSSVPVRSFTNTFYLLGSKIVPFVQVQFNQEKTTGG